MRVRNGLLLIRSTLHARMKRSISHLAILSGLLVLPVTTTIAQQTGSSKRPLSLPDTSITAAAPTKADAQTSWSFLSLGACGVDEFIKQHPTFDGRGTIIAILDDGVDIGIEGLLQTSEGKRKFIDVQDFSGTGDLTYQEVHRDDDAILNGNSVLLHGLNKKGVTSIDGKYYYAALDESRFKNGLGDLNFNGSKTDIFGVLIYEDAKDHYAAIVDANADGDLSDESVVHQFKEQGEMFRFRASSPDRHDERFLSGAVNFFPSEHRINLYFADGGHGTHVAGIAGGCNIDGQQGFNGVAPGAQMVAMKFADNTAGGVTVSGSMKKAYEYIAALAKETGKPVIANMSFGIGNELEGSSAMDQWLDSLLEAHPDLIVCISAGNEGPGLSNIGLPGSARMVITSGAALPYDTGRDLYGLATNKHVVWDFSSRGGELAKPDIVSPGTAISTVPDYVGHDRYNGTSMSSPYTTGCSALLVSAMQQSYGSAYIPNIIAIKRALQLGAKPLEGLTMLDQGAGMINVPAAFDWLSKWQREKNAPTHYDIKTDVPTSGGSGSAAYYRNGYYPTHGERTTFYITPLDQAHNGSRESKLGFHAFDLVSTAKWIQPVQSSIYHRGDGALEASVKYDESLLKEPGLYTGKVLAYKKGSPHTIPEFELWNTVVIPNELNAQNNFTCTVDRIPIKAGMLSRQFFRIPPSAKAVEVWLSGADDATSADAVLIDHDGKGFTQLRLRPTDGSIGKHRWLSGEELPDGIWEIVVKRGLGSDDELPKTVSLKIQAYPFDLIPSFFRASKDEMSGSFSLTNQTAVSLDMGSARATIDGYERFIDTTISSADVFTLPFSKYGNEGRASFDVTLEKKDYNLFTDISLQILRPDSSSVYNGAFDWAAETAHVSFTATDTTAYMLKFRGGLATPEKPHTFKLHIRERREFDAVTSGFKCTISSGVKHLYPAEREQFYFQKNISIPLLPPGYRFYGSLMAVDAGNNQIEFPIEY